MDTLEVIKKEDIKKYSNNDNRDDVQKVKDLQSDVKNDAVANAMNVEAGGAG